MNHDAGISADRQTIVVVGKESVGKSQLVSSLTNQSAGEMNFAGSTVSVQRYQTEDAEFLDTPGILRKSDTETTRLALAAIEGDPVVLLVVQATHLDDDLDDMLPLVVGKRGAVVITHWDKVKTDLGLARTLARLSSDAGVPMIPVDARRLKVEQRERISDALAEPGRLQKPQLDVKAGWRIEPEPGPLEHPTFGPMLAITMLVWPALVTVFGANWLADLCHPVVSNWLDPLIAAVNNHAPTPIQVVLTAQHGDFGYGLLNMGPFLLVWALPTVILFSLILGVYKASGLVGRLNVALDPLVRPLGLSGRDVIRVMMGLGCNVPAVISTRACSGCSRGQTISAIAFGAACSYQLPATLAVLAAGAASTGSSPVVLNLVFLSYLMLTTLLYLRLTAPREARNSMNVLMTPKRSFMQWPTPGALWREASGTIRQFLLKSLPIFAVICVIASLLTQFGVLDLVNTMLGSVMSIFNLPPQTALPIVLASIRKDGIFLLAAEDGLAFPMTATQTLTAVYLAGVLLPCLVTAMTIGRETTWGKASKLLVQQASFAILFAIILAWAGRWIFAYLLA